MAANIIDPWFCQVDMVERWLKKGPQQNAWITVAETRDSYVEHLYTLLLPIGPRRAANCMADVAWGMDFDYSKAAMVERRLNHTHYLGLRFRRMFQLMLTPLGDYRTDNQQAIVKRALRQSKIGTYESITAKRVSVMQFLAKTNQKAIWCVRSQRYSERGLRDFALKEGTQQARSQGHNFVLEFMELSPQQKVDIPRMQSMSLLFGKRLV